MDFSKIIEHFVFGNGEFLGYEPFGMGHINDTYALSFVGHSGDTVRYVVQRVNHKIFPDIKALMSNILAVTDFLRKQVIADGGKPERECLKFLKGVDGLPYYTDGDGNGWRAYELVENAVSYQIAESPEQFKDAGKAFGTFVRRLDGFPANSLHEIVKNFHNTKSRFNDLKKAIDVNYGGRTAAVKQEISFVIEREKYCDRIVSALADGTIPTRVTHNDTKLNNVLFDTGTGRAICVIDLDTIMPGSLLYDFGDAIRSGCNTGEEDEEDLAKVNFDINLFKAFLDGFLGAVGDKITDNERKLLAFSGILMTYECGMRFLGDFLNGDVYFKVKYPEHNLTRARTQFKLVADMEKVLDKMNALALAK